MSRVFRVFIGFVVAAGFFAGQAEAQFKSGAQPTELSIPRVSQRGSVTQRVGLTDVTIVYSRPAVGGREIWGKIVPYGKVWRSGANENTTISFTDDVSIEGKPLAAGTYGLHTIPEQDQWVIVFAELTELVTYDFDDVKQDSATAVLRWEKIAVPFQISVDTKAVVLRSIKNELRNVGGFTWAGFDEAANWCLDNNYNLEQALKWEDTSIQNEERFENLLTKSQILVALGKTEEANATRAKALDKASGLQLHVYGRGLQIQKKQDEGFAVFKINVQKHPNEWYTHGELARMASAKGDFPTALKEMKLALAGAPDATKNQIQGLIARLEKSQDINPI
jgi:hypothetical protein